MIHRRGWRRENRWIGTVTSTKTNAGLIFSWNYRGEHKSKELQHYGMERARERSSMQVFCLPEIFCKESSVKCRRHLIEKSAPKAKKLLHHLPFCVLLSA
jgi:hypothetical protein